jgi:dipeptidyl aminopeptidase/acylaminoacyl peptidase
VSAFSTDLGALSGDERLVCLEHSEHGDLIHPALRIVESATGATVAEVRDEGSSIVGFAWSPILGDQRLLIGHERTGELRPAVWDVEQDTITDLPLSITGLIEPADWWPDASAVLLIQLLDGRHRLLRFDLAAGTAEELPTPQGSIEGARVRPDGTVWYRLQDGEAPPRLLQVGLDEPLLVPGGPAAPPGRPFRSWEFDNPHGQRVHGFLVHPEAEGPHPLLMFIHGGPTWLDMDRWTPEVQAYVDAGFLVAMVNYRGSIGFGRAWRDEIMGNIGWPEVEDILAGFDDLLARGLVDAERAVIAGWSWGGYLTLLMHGMHPERFRAGIAGVPVGDYAAGYEELSPTLQAYDRSLLGGAPAEVPELVAERSPISYVDRVTAPILFLAGRNDTRCPLGQVLLYTDRLAARGHPHELYVYETGHASFETEERIRQRALILDFLARHVPGIELLPEVTERKPAPLRVAKA